MSGIPRPQGQAAMVTPKTFVAIFVVAASSAVMAPCHAGWHHRHGCGSCGSHAHRWQGSFGSSGGSSGGSYGGSAGAAGTPKPAAPAAGKASARVHATGALLVIQVPGSAAVLINGQRTNLSGTVREFLASGLAEDGRYEYEVTMLVDDGATRREVTKTVWLAAGTEQILSFDRGLAATDATAVASDSHSVNTSLTLTVPADAEVWIEGQRTAPTGSVRHYSTTQLARGQHWPDYEIRVVTTIGGRERSAVRTITLTGGENAELSVDPDHADPGIEATAYVR